MPDRMRGERSYTDLFVLFAKPVERWLKRLILLFVVLLIVCQFLLQFAEIRYFLTAVERLEGVTTGPDKAD